jgi:uncharacterized protein YyaL (SSP411 family)
MNQLANEKSPYLKQHASNPVWWHSWGADAFEKARKENKLIFLSIGYSTCHWCHVMEHESFTQQSVADILNKNFISIKVDREERPDVDSIYMNILVGLNGHGGWPLNMILTPEREAFFGGTYYPRLNFMHLLSEVSRVWTETPEQIQESGRRISEWLKGKDRNSSVGELDEEVFQIFYQGFLESFDFEDGGRKGAPKFIPSYGLRVLMRIYRQNQNEQVLSMIHKTLEAISRGGIYDHLGGGFHRYATDSAWLIPHFEKMLYDQAATSQLFLEAYQLTGEQEYKLVLEETLEYILRDMTSAEGGFYSAEDADSEGVEGTFYVWTIGEMKKLVTEHEFNILDETYSLSVTGNFEEKNILELRRGLTRTNFGPNLRSAQSKLFKARALRPRPLRDEKILVSWNGLMISAFAKAGAALGEGRYIAAAQKSAQFILDHICNQNGELLHQSIEGMPQHDGLLEDYAFFIDALLELYQADFNEKWLLEARRLQGIQERLFLDPQSGDYFNSNGKDIYLIKREKSFLDNVTPSGNSMTLFNLLRLSDFFFDDQLKEKALHLFKKFPKEVKSYPSEFVQMLMAFDYLRSEPQQIAVSTKNDAKEMLDVVRSGFFPNKIVAKGESVKSEIPLLQNRPMLDQLATAYVCVNQTCRLPTTDLHQLKQLVQS